MTADEQAVYVKECEDKSVTKALPKGESLLGDQAREGVLFDKNGKKV